MYACTEPSKVGFSRENDDIEKAEVLKIFRRKSYHA